MIQNEEDLLLLANKNIPNYMNEIDLQSSPYIDVEISTQLQQTKNSETKTLILEDLTEYDEQYNIVETKLCCKSWKYINLCIGLIFDACIGFHGFQYPFLSYILSYIVWDRRRSLSLCIIFWNLLPKVIVFIVFSSYIFSFSGSKAISQNSIQK